MPARTLPNLGLQAFFDLGEDEWNDEMDLNMLKLSVLTQGGAISKVSTTPGTPTDGDVHIFAGDHPTNANDIAVYDVDTWKYITPEEGWLVYNRDQNYFELFDGSAWAEFETGGGGAATGGVFKVRAASAAAVTLASDVENGDSLDGVTLATGDRILLKDQADASENGVYVVAASGAPTRAEDADSSDDLVNYACLVAEGTANADKFFQCTTNAPITVDTTDLTWAEITGGGGGGNDFAPVQDEGADYTVDPADAGNFITLSNAGTKSVTVEPESTTALPANGEWHFCNTGSGNATFVEGSGVTISPPNGGTLVVPGDATVTLKRIGTDSFRLFGQVVAA